MNISPSTAPQHLTWTAPNPKFTVVGFASSREHAPVWWVLDDGRRLTAESAPNVTSTQDAIRAAALIATQAGTGVAVYRSLDGARFEFGPLLGADGITKRTQPLTIDPIATKYFDRTKDGVLGANESGMGLRAIVTPSAFAAWAPGVFDGGVLPLDRVTDVGDAEVRSPADDVVASDT